MPNPLPVKQLTAMLSYHATHDSISDYRSRASFKDGFRVCTLKQAFN